MNRKCKFEGRCREKHPTVSPAKLENGKCSNKSCNLAHPQVCINLVKDKFCRMRNCRYIHPTNIKNEYDFRDNQQRPNINANNLNQQQNAANNSAPNRHRDQHNYSNRQWGGPQVYNTGYNQHRIQNAQGSHMNNNQNFPQYYQTPENTMSTQQTLSRILGSIEKMDARVNYMEMRQTNNWNY